MSDTTSGHSHERQVPRPRDGAGRFTRGVDSVHRDAEAARLRGRSWTWQAISDHLGYGSEGNVRRAVGRLLAEIPAPSVAELRAEVDAQLDVLASHAAAVLEAKHLKFDRGVAVTHDGKPVEDDGPVLAAVETLRKVLADRRALYGLDAPVKSHVTGRVVRYVLEGQDPDEIAAALT